MSLRENIERIKLSGCDLCPELVSFRKSIVIYKGNPDADVCIVGQAPGENEDINGVPFVGRAGQLLDSIIKDAGFDPDNDFFFTNVTLCRRENNEAPSQTHLANCSSNFKQLTTKFNKILTVGKVAAVGTAMAWGLNLVNRFQLLSMYKILTGGMPYLLDNGKSMYCTYHTSYLLRSGVLNGHCDNKLYQIVRNEIIASKTDRENVESLEFEGSLF